MNKSAIYGAVIGDMVGSIYEFRSTGIKDRVKTFPFWSGHSLQLFKSESEKNGSVYTDDTVTGLAVANALMKLDSYEDDDRVREVFTEEMRSLCPKYEWTGYGSRFWIWLNQPKPAPYESYGNGSAMRVFPIGMYFDTLEETRRIARLSADITHNHVEGIKGAESVATAMFMARTGGTKAEIKNYIQSEFGYNLDKTLDEIRPQYGFDVTCQGSVPESILCFLEGNSFEECVRLAVSLGGDTDTMGCITGAIASMMYPIPQKHIKQAKRRLSSELLAVAERFETEIHIV